MQEKRKVVKSRQESSNSHTHTDTDKEKIVIKPCRPGFEPLEDAIKLVIGTNGSSPVDLKRRCQRGPKRGSRVSQKQCFLAFRINNLQTKYDRGLCGTQG